MLEDFSGRFLAARDRGLSPHESWYRKQGNRPKGFADNTVELWFVRELEYLTADDWYGVLLDAAHSDYQYADFHFRYRISMNDALRLMIEYQAAYLMPLNRARYIGSIFAAPRVSPEFNLGLVSVALYAATDIPPEFRHKKISEEDFHKILLELGCEKVEIPHWTKN